MKFLDNLNLDEAVQVLNFSRKEEAIIFCCWCAAQIAIDLFPDPSDEEENMDCYLREVTRDIARLITNKGYNIESVEKLVEETFAPYQKRAREILENKQ
jgi:DNA-dependent RNA polymerase auxiliary subunit epsilon